MAQRHTGVFYQINDGRYGCAYEHQQKLLENRKKDVLLKLTDENMKPLMNKDNPTQQLSCFKHPSDLTFLGYID